MSMIKPFEQILDENNTEYRVFTTKDNKIVFQTCEPSTVTDENNIITKVGVKWADTFTVVAPEDGRVIDVSVPVKKAGICIPITTGFTYDVNAQSHWEQIYKIYASDIIGMTLQNFIKLENEIIPAADKLVAEYGGDYCGNRSIREYFDAYQNAISLDDRIEALCMLGQAWGQSGHNDENKIENRFYEQYIAMKSIR